jgi:ADP-ribose pyrophosphatase YjhB (NUDIX family)
MGKIKDYFRGLHGRKTRSLALAVIRNAEGKLLLHRARDSLKGEIFYRPLGGGIEFGETEKVATARELEEELGVKAEVGNLIATFENIFSYEGIPGHEIVLVYEVRFIDTSLYLQKEIDIVESGQVIGQAVWRSIDEIIREGAKLYPVGIEAAIKMAF